MTDHRHQTNGRAMAHDHGKVPDAKEQEAEREACTCSAYVGPRALRVIETCPLHTPPARLTDED